MRVAFARPGRRCLSSRTSCLTWWAARAPRFPQVARSSTRGAGRAGRPCSWAGVGGAALSTSGSLIYESGRSVGQPLLVDADGRGAPLIREPREFSVPRYSRDGQRVAFTVGTATSQDVWIYALQSGTLTRLTTDGLNTRPEWSPDGKIG